MGVLDGLGERLAERAVGEMRQGGGSAARACRRRACPGAFPGAFPGAGPGTGAGTPLPGAPDGTGSCAGWPCAVVRASGGAR